MTRVTKAGVTERMGERKWQSPFHAGGIRPQSIFGAHVGAPLTDKQIDSYVRAGVYRNSRYYRKELRKIRELQKIFDPPQRLVYDIEKQDFVEI